MPRDVHVHIYSATLLHTDNYIQTIAYRQWPVRGPGLWSGESELHGVGDRQRPIGGEPDGRHQVVSLSIYSISLPLVQLFMYRSIAMNCFAFIGY